MVIDSDAWPLVAFFGGAIYLDTAGREAAKRTLGLVAGSFSLAAVLAVVVLSSVDIGEPQNPDLAGGAYLTAAIFGAIGLVVALFWLSRFDERQYTADKLTIGFIVRVAIAELGLLMGIVGLFMTGSRTASYIGLGFFLAAMLSLVGVLRRAV